MLWPVALMLVLGVALSGLLTDTAGNELGYSEFLDRVENGQVEQVTIGPEGGVDGELANGDTFTTTVPTAPGDEQLIQTLKDNGVQIDATRPSTGFGEILLSLAPFLLLIGLFVYFGRRARGQLSQIRGVGQSKAKVITKERPKTGFDEVAGYDGVKQEVQEAVEYLKDPSRFKSLGARGPGGLLMVGPPGTGKTLIARAVAGEADVPFFSVSGSSFVEMFVGVGASRVRDMFDQAKKLAPAIIFIDELDAIGGSRRGSTAMMSNTEQEQTLNQLLAEMDGFDPTEGLVIMAATNRPGMLDEALLRPGRFDRQIEVGAPLLSDRVEILGVHVRGKPLDDGVDLDRVARATPGFTGADLQNLVNEAAITAVRREHELITQDDFDTARDRILIGRREESSMLRPEERERVAVHEAGHAVVGAVCEAGDPVSKITILPTRQALGTTQQLPEGERRLYPESYLRDTMAMSLGGRAAELTVLGEASSGAANDLAGATRIAEQMVRDFGLSERLGPVGYHREHGPMGPDEALAKRPYAEETQRVIDEEIARILREQDKRAHEIVTECRGPLDRLVELLLEQETVDGATVYELIGKQPPASTEAAQSTGAAPSQDSDGATGEAPDRAADEEPDSAAGDAPDSAPGKAPDSAGGEDGRTGDRKPGEGGVGEAA